MRGSPSCVIPVRRSGLWRIAVGVVAAAAISALVAWALLTPLGQTSAARIAVVLAALATLGLAASLLRMPTGTLRWDGSAWTFAEQARRPTAPLPGELEVAIDLGAFLLLRFRPGGTPAWRSTRWIPVERRGLEREWHSFRCAVYSPRPGPDGAADPQLH
jgi:hypothetical protein